MLKKKNKYIQKRNIKIINVSIRWYAENFVNSSKHLENNFKALNSVENLWK